MAKFDHATNLWTRSIDYNLNASVWSRFIDHLRELCQNGAQLNNVRDWLIDYLDENQGEDFEQTTNQWTWFLDHLSECFPDAGKFKEACYSFFYYIQRRSGDRDLWSLRRALKMKGVRPSWLYGCYEIAHSVLQLSVEGTLISLIIFILEIWTENLKFKMLKL